MSRLWRLIYRLRIGDLETCTPEIRQLEDVNAVLSRSHADEVESFAHFCNDPNAVFRVKLKR